MNKDRKKRWSVPIIAAIVVTILYLTMGQKSVPLSEHFKEETVKQQAMDDVTLGESGDYEAWKARFAPEQQGTLTEEAYKSYLETVDEKGKFQEFTQCVLSGQEKQGSNYAVAVLSVKHELGTMKYALIYNEDMQIVTYTV